jgi:hypothetical protein
MTGFKSIGLSIVMVFAMSLGFSGCGNGNADSQTKSDITSVTSNLTTSLPDGSDNIPLNENIELKDNVKVLSQEDVDNMTIEQDETDSDKFTITIGQQANNSSARKFSSLRSASDYNVGDIIMISVDVALNLTNPLNFAYKIASINGSKIAVVAVSNICEVLDNGTMSNNPKTLAPFQKNSSITYETFEGTKEFGTTLKHDLTYEVVPTITIQCRNSELHYMNAGIAGYLNLESSLFDASSYESSEIEMPLAATQINVGKAKIGLFLEFRPSIELSQNIYNSPKLTLNKTFSFLRTYINGSWSDNDYSENSMSDTKPTFTGIKQEGITNPTMSVSLNGKFYVGLGGKVNKKGAEAGMSATIIPTLSLKDKDDCKVIDNDMDAKLEVGFDSILGGYAYAPDYLSWKLYKDVQIAEIMCEVDATTDLSSKGLMSGTKTYSNNAKYNISVDFSKNEYCVSYNGQQCSDITITSTSTNGVEFYTYPKSNPTCKHTFVGNFDTLGNDATGDLLGSFTNNSCADSSYGTFKLSSESEQPITQTSTELSDGLVAHYKFEGNTNDSSGNGNHGTEYGGVSYVDGMVGKSVYLKTPSDYIISNNKLELNNFTFSLFANLEQDMEDTTYTGQYGKSNTIINGVIENGSPGGRENSFSLHWNSGELKFNDSNREQVKSQQDILNKWKYITITRNDGEMSLYLNGSVVSTIDTSNKIMNIYNIAIGKEFDCESGCFEDSQSLLGQIDDLRIYNRALSEVEIQELYNLGK